MDPGQDSALLPLALVVVGFIEAMMLIVIIASFRFMAKKR